MVTLDATAVTNEDQLGPRADDTDSVAIAVAEAIETLRPAEQEPSGEPENDTASQPDCGEVAPHRIRTITLELPETCETRVVLLCQQGEDGNWRSGFDVKRNYDCSPHAAEQIDQPSAPADDEGYPALGDAVMNAVERASWWIGTNSADDDAKASEAADALDAWGDEIVPETATPAMFDDATAADFAKAAGGENAEQDVTVSEQDASKDPQQQTMDLVSAKPEKSPVVAVTTDADADHENQKNELAWTIATKHIELAKAKASVKRLSKQIDSAVAELEVLEEDGPEELPLFDRIPAEAPKAENLTEGVGLKPGEIALVDIRHEPHPDDSPELDIEPAKDETKSAQDETKSAQDETNPDLKVSAEPWRETQIADIGLTSKIIEILENERIYTLGNWVDWPQQHPGVEYTQIKNAAGAVTEKRYEKIMEAVTKATT